MPVPNFIKDMSPLQTALFVVALLFPVISLAYGFFGWKAAVVIGLAVGSALGGMLYLNENLIGGAAGRVYGGGDTRTDYVTREYMGDMNTAMQLVRDRKFEKAADLYAAIVEKAPKKVEPLWHLAQMHDKLKRPVPAQLTYKRLIERFAAELGDEHPYVHEARARIAAVSELAAAPSSRRVPIEIDES